MAPLSSPIRSPLSSAVRSAFERSRGPAGPLPDPLLTAASVTVINETAASASVYANRDNGILYWVASTSATQPTATQIKAGQNHLGAAAPAAGSQAISESGVQDVFGDVIGLTAGTTYYLHFYFETDALEPSNTLTSASFVPADVTAPVLSSAEGTQTGATTANLTVNTDTASGTLFWVATTSATTPSQAQIIAGQDHTGAAAVGASRSVTASGPQAFGITGLAGSTEYWAHFVHRDTALNVSVPITVSASFTTPSVTFYFQAFHNGAVPANNQSNALFTANYADSLGGSNAVLFSADGLGTGTAEQVRIGPAVTWVAGVTEMKVRFKVINKVAAKMWLRVRAENISGFVGTFTHIDITDDGTPDGSRVGSSNFTGVSVVSIGDGWFEMTARTDATSASDRIGNFFLYMATAAGGFTIVNNVAGVNEVAIHNLTFEQI